MICIESSDDEVSSVFSMVTIFLFFIGPSLGFVVVVIVAELR